MDVRLALHRVKPHSVDQSQPCILLVFLVGSVLVQVPKVSMLCPGHLGREAEVSKIMANHPEEPDQRALLFWEFFEARSAGCQPSRAMGNLDISPCLASWKASQLWGVPNWPAFSASEWPAT